MRGVGAFGGALVCELVGLFVVVLWADVDVGRRQRARGEAVTRSDRCLLHRPDGTPCYIVDTASPVHDAEGAVSGVVVVLHDATESMARDRELTVGASIGAASLRPGLANLAEWVAAADRACYEAKRAAGRGRMKVAA